ncbi:hypothetical protein CIL05_13130 [Virgibacillus profundi]|uniref:Uncharacterized protein n=1 Tax=Virgibacillus profundi TaxID=2024555 RepID=A0A2A2IE30_9BACI|nr:ABC transporter permease [Virgibacillus profundi]PAV29333.1 hypothetical protein CIL05_13130 [Virgibacillus profundi]PXY53502.1 hypothetical protein CIT14_13255 [Virgibacillus profundi]
MSKTWVVMKTMLKMQYSKAGKSNSQIWLYVIAGLFFVPLLFFYIGIINNLVEALYNVLQPLGQDSLILGLLFLGIHMLLFLISFITVLSAFYFAEDIESFIPFPLHSYQVLLGKAANPFLYLYLTASAVFLPAFFFYGAISGANILYYLYGIIMFVLLPIIPFTIAAILLMLVMRFVNIAKNKDRSKVIAGIFSLAFIILINVLVRLNTNSGDLINNLAVFVQEKDGLLRMITSYYPPAFFSTMGLTEASSFSGFLFLLAVIVISAAAFFLFIWLGQLLYLKGVLGIGAGNKRKSSQKKIKKQIAARPVWLSYMLKELRIIFRTPTFFMQCVVQSLFGPVFLLIILMLDSGDLTGFMNMFSKKESMLILFIATSVLVGSNAASISSISREGKSWPANLFLPLDPKQIFFSKIAAAWSLNLIVIALVLAICVFLFQLPMDMILIWLILILITSWLSSILGTYLDLLQPKLNWTDEQEVFKTRFIGLIALIIQVGIFGVLVLILWNIDAIQGLYTSSFVLFIVIVIATFVMSKLLSKKIKQNEHQHI